MRMTFSQQDNLYITQRRLCGEELSSVRYYLREIFCFTASSKRVLHVPLYVSVSVSYSSHKLCGATAQRVRFGILDFFFLFFFKEWGGGEGGKGGLDKFRASRSVWDGLTEHRERACSTRS